MSDMRVRFVNDEENRTVGDMSNSSEGPDPEHEMYRDLADRYMAQPISQADFFRPTELIATRERTDGTGTVAPKLVVDENVPDDPNVPRIIIHGPDENYAHADSIEKPVLKKAAPLEKKLRVSIEERPKPGARRHSISVVPEKQQAAKPNSVTSSTQKTAPKLPQWKGDERHPKGGCRMKTRCSPTLGGDSTMDIVMVYLYSSNLCDKSTDPDADLDIFRHREKSEITRPTAEPSPKLTIRRAKTDLPNPSRQILPMFSTQVQDRIAARRSERRPVSWLQDQDMLQKQFPGCRIILVGFEIASVLSNQAAFVSAAAQLDNYLQGLRRDQQPPIAVLGHSLGGVIVMQAFVSASSGSNLPSNILPHIIGIFFFSCSINSPERCARLLTELFGTKTTEKVLSDMFNSPAMKQLSKMAKSRPFVHEPHIEPVSGSTRHHKDCPRNIRRIAIGFPITQVFGRGEEQRLNGDSLGGFLGTSIRTVTMSRDAAHALRFPASSDVDFLRITLLLQSKLQTSSILHAALAGDLRKLETSLREGITPNLRDRLSVHASVSFCPHSS
ncbi:hypothetical protein Ptr902_04665 [Pyrenophora tritici-repentis]|nr:hypothetical protein Ptr902_04665 [Pyrenophora tritici-repentis]